MRVLSHSHVFSVNIYTNQCPGESSREHSVGVIRWLTNRFRQLCWNLQLVVDR